MLPTRLRYPSFRSIADPDGNKSSLQRHVPRTSLAASWWFEVTARWPWRVPSCGAGPSVAVARACFLGRRTVGHRSGLFPRSRLEPYQPNVHPGAGWPLAARHTEKTRIVHLDEGFDFLGYHVRQYKNPRTRTGRKRLIRPSKEAVKKLRDKLKAVWMEHKGKSAVTVCQKLNPIIRGWANYYRTVVSTRTFKALYDWMFKRACQWARHRHPKKPISWRSQRYWGRLNRMRADNWVFGDKRSGCYLLKFKWFLPRRHAMVKATASPDDPRLREYSQRQLEAKAAGLGAAGNIFAAMPQSGSGVHHR